MDLDLTIVSYKIAGVAIMYNLLLFIVWLIMTKREEGHVSEVYIIVMCLFATRFGAIAMSVVARSKRGTESYYTFTDGFWWDFRVGPEAIVFIVLAFVLTRRFVKSYLFRDPKYIAKNGNRRTDK